MIISEVILVLTMSGGVTVQMPQPNMQTCRETLYTQVVQKRTASTGFCVNTRTGRVINVGDTR